MTRLVGAGLLLVLAAAPLLAWSGGPGYPLLVMTRGVVFAVAAVSLQFLLGFAGLASFGHAAMMGIGAYAALASDGRDLLVVVPTAMAAAALFAVATGLISLRTRGVTYIMITLAFGQMAFFVAQAWTPLGGDDGMPLDARSPLLGSSLLTGRYGFYFVSLGVLLGWGLLLRAAARSRFGRALRGAAGNATRVESLGFDVFRLRLAATAVAGAGGGLAGVLLANLSEFVSPAVLDWRASGLLLVMAILGGRGSLRGSIDGLLIGAAAGAIGLVATEEALSMTGEHGGLLLGPALILAALSRRRPA